MTDTATKTAAQPGSDTSGKLDDDGADQQTEQKNGRQSDSGDQSKPDDLEKLRTALANERELRKDAEKRARAGEAHKAKLDELESANQSETEKAIAQARNEARAELMAQVNSRLIAAEARGLAGEMGFRSSSSAAKLVDLSEVGVTEAGVVDTAAIRKALQSLASEEPYLLAADDGKPRTPKPDPSQGGTGGKPAPQGAERGLAEAERRFGKRSNT